MAGRGSRLRPHTLTIPKPLVPVGGKPIVHRLVEDIASVCTEKIEEIAFVIGDFGEEVEKELIKVAEGLGAKGSIYYQNEPLGTAHAVLCEGRRRRDGKGQIVVVRVVRDPSCCPRVCRARSGEGRCWGRGRRVCGAEMDQSTCSRAVRRTLFTGSSSFAFPFLRRP